MRVAVIGLGSAGRRHVGNLLALGCEVGRYDWAEQSDVRPVLDLRISQWDAVVIATPWDRHLNYVVWAIAERTPFYVEKPIGSLEQLQIWREVAAMDLPVNQVGYQLRFHPRYRAMRQFIPKPIEGAFRCDFDMATWPGKAYGPPELEASHELDLALDCGLSAADVVLNSGAKEYLRDWCICDGHAMAEVQFESAEDLGDQMYVDAMAHFLDCVREGKPTICPLAHGLRVLEALA